MEAERESEIELMITAGLKAPKPLLDKVVAGGVSAACALQMLCTNKHAPWVEKVAGISACVSAFAQCIERHACAAAVDASNRLELFTFLSARHVQRTVLCWRQPFRGRKEATSQARAANNSARSHAS